MDLKTKIALVAGCTVVVAFAVVFLLNSSNFSTGQVIANNGATDSFVNCLNDKGVLLYGFENSLQVKAQLDLFGNISRNLNVIDCRSTPEKCIGVIIYPSWNIEGRIISSGLSLGILSDLSGCKL